MLPPEYEVDMTTHYYTLRDQRSRKV